MSALLVSMFALGATPAHAVLLSLSQFGSQGSANGQFQAPIGVAVDQLGGRVYVADSANARIEKFNAKGNFVSAWGWGVVDGSAKSEVCRGRTSCKPGIAGSGPGQLASPTSIAVDRSHGPSSGDVYVGDAANNVVVKFNASGKYLTTIDGSTTPQGAFSSLAGVAVDQSGNLWTADRNTNNIDEFDGNGNFVQQWTDPFFGQTNAIAVDSTNDAVYLIDQDGTTDRFTLAGGSETQIDSGQGLVSAAGLALAVDPQSGDLYIDHGSEIRVYDRTGTRTDTISLGATTNSQGLAYRATRGTGRMNRLYVSDEDNDQVTIYGPPGPGLPAITAASATAAGKTGETLHGTIVTLGHATSCTFEYVDNAHFQKSGYGNATSVGCTPGHLGPSFTYQHASANVGGLTVGVVYHFHVVATTTGGTTTSADQTFQAGPGDWAPFFRCPVDDPAMLATDGGVNTLSICLGSNSTHGSFTIGSLTTLTANTNLQAGLISDSNTGLFTIVPPAGGALLADPAVVTVAGFNVVATVESAGLPSNFDLFAGLEIGAPIITLPIKIHLQGANIDLGPSCFIGSDQDPIVLNPQNTDISNAAIKLETFAADGTPDLAGTLSTIAVAGTVQGDDAFTVPAVQGCGPNGDGSLDGLINGLVGLPSPSGANHLVLEDASSAVGFPGNDTGQDFANLWHGAFD